MIIERSDQLSAALNADLGKTGDEAIITEISVVMNDINESLANLKVRRGRRWRSFYIVSTPSEFTCPTSTSSRTPPGVDEARSVPFPGAGHAVLLRGSAGTSWCRAGHQPVQLPCQVT